MSTLDPVDYDLNRYLGQIERAEAFDEAVDARAAELMLPGKPYCPTDAYNRDEAISELGIDPEAMTAVDFGRVRDYWVTAARNQLNPKSSTTASAALVAAAAAAIRLSLSRSTTDQHHQKNYSEEHHVRN